MKIKDCMTTKAVTLKRATPLSKVMEIFRDTNFHLLPVVEDGNVLAGVVTFEDILKVFQPYSSDLAQLLKANPFLEISDQEELLEADLSPELGILIVVDDLMAKEFLVISPDENITKAYTEMKLHNTGILLVTEGGRLSGIITLFDIILALFKEKGVII
ncbi:MAG: CBS domain-containing protein [Candidatus Omnitrophota bacterium]